MIGLLKGMYVTFSVMLRKPVTRQYPDLMRDLAARNRGLPLLVWDQEHDEPVCIGCRQCDEICPVRCITVVGPADNPRFRPRDHDEKTCEAEHSSPCPHISPRKTIPEHFLIDEDRCMRCGLCEYVCPTDQDRYGNLKAIVVGTGHLSVQASVYDRNDNVLDLDRLTYYSRVLKLELNAVVGTRRPKDGLLINTAEAAGLRLKGRNPLPLGVRLKARMFRLYAPLWLVRRGLPQQGKPRAG
jgi:formate hydrogenlyase subunit 6/NADH:ubiquinone oxidoreductase subunit I